MKRTLITALLAVTLAATTATPAFAIAREDQPLTTDQQVIAETMPDREDGGVYEMTPAPDQIVLVEDIPESHLMWYSAPVEAPRHAVTAYVIQQDDTLWKIVSKSLNTTNSRDISNSVATIVEINNLPNPDMLLVGQELTIPMDISSQ